MRRIAAMALICDRPRRSTTPSKRVSSTSCSFARWTEAPMTPSVSTSPSLSSPHEQFPRYVITSVCCSSFRRVTSPRRARATCVRTLGLSGSSNNIKKSVGRAPAPSSSKGARSKTSLMPFAHALRTATVWWAATGSTIDLSLVRLNNGSFRSGNTAFTIVPSSLATAWKSGVGSRHFAVKTSPSTSMMSRVWSGAMEINRGVAQTAACITESRSCRSD
mmetsp:Transcript_153/g.518  ORF Transcript_153/g.518 Transcript_153/m.518 type:complete len:219 (+) Transcript_153:249-905(+)